ncbi:LLM class flavin-dependent oxidoreductase [Amycolatopsis australiensis]|uniref:Flavin-dependent oxidoreductase, luciferase family (Includes alkanesulfonate monooxygenase SsuD and methylene tetrahydromethanopterin reductase) n=1 Tax=Amycolatopsis australiensis TaxID=546364 RepID=A0A1K1SR68_9PSEU|nr:LLM class flavin-dependent oxidoreductase [Amycolatopsis australiensis]SFW86708.1 Flavin-dependent oxidoreductase, luciferase family (includes alkanesulfonate monooxygenase SsuD and methylene tetrahydromethanopterin reductase) [Amycolatopsis australiensis]
MQFWHFSECAYPDLPDPETYASVRVTLPNGVIDPGRAAGLWDRYIREWEIADECGLNVMVNEHHSTATCMNSAAPVVAGVLARVTSRARILILGNPVANRPDPVRIAEEMALVDLLSHGRLDVGFVRGVQYEVAATNAKPVRMTERMWEAIELITRAWTTHDGPFNWEGEFFHHRQVNIWPRPYQQPSPPVWVTAVNPASVPRIADHGYRLGTFLSGFEGTRKVFQAYRDRCAETGKPQPGDERFGYAALVYTGKTDEEGFEGARKLLWYLHSNKVTQEFTYPPGYMPYPVRAAGLRGGAASGSGAPASSPIPDLTSLSVRDLIDRGLLFAGSPSSVAAQIERFHEHVGGFGHLLLMGQAGHLDHDETARGIRRFAEDVVPALDRVTDRVAV